MAPYGKKLKARGRGVKQRREAITAAVIKIMERGEPTKFAFEGACRHGLRSSFCLHGQSWRDADKLAGEIVTEALRRLGAERPAWSEGQPEYVITYYGRERYYCARCGTPIPDERRETGGRPIYCSHLCASNARAEKARRSGERASAAERAAQLAADRKRRHEEQTRPCEHCGKPFSSPDPLKRFCSVPCTNAARVVPDDKRTCEQCGKTFLKKRWHDGRYCSQRCMGDAMVKPRPVRTCAHCGNEYVQKYTYQNTRFCSWACSGAANRKALPEFQCQRCGVVFQAKYTWAKPKFCSRGCANEAKRKTPTNSFSCEAT